MLKRSEPVEGKDYAFVDVNDGHTHVKILKGRFKGAMIRYDQVKVLEDGDNAVLKFHFTIFETGKRYNKEQLEKNQKFFNHLGRILQNILIYGRIGKENNYAVNAE